LIAMVRRREISSVWVLIISVLLLPRYGRSPVKPATALDMMGERPFANSGI